MTFCRHYQVSPVHSRVRNLAGIWLEFGNIRFREHYAGALAGAVGISSGERRSGDLPVIVRRRGLGRQ